MNIGKILATALCGALAAGVVGCAAAPEQAAGTAAPSEATASASQEGGTKDKSRGSGSRSQGGADKAQSLENTGDPKTNADLSDKDRTDTWSPSSPRIELRGQSISSTDSSVQVDGSTATITKAGTYILSGSLEDGQIRVSVGDTDDVQLVLDGASLSSSTGSPLVAEAGDKVILTLAPGTENRVSDAATYVDTSDQAPDAAIYADCDLSINGSGSLEVTASYEDGIKTKDDLRIAGGTIQVTAEGHGLKGKDSVGIADGSVTIQAGNDGIQSDQDSETSKGWVAIDGGTFNITAGDDAISACTLLTVNGGDFAVETGGGSENGPAHTSGFGGDRGFGDMRDFDPSQFEDGEKPDFGDLDPSEFGDGEKPDFGDLDPSHFGDGERPDFGDFDPSQFGDGERPQRPGHGNGSQNPSADGGDTSQDIATALLAADASDPAQSAEAEGPEAPAEEPQPAATLPGAPGSEDAASDGTADGSSRRGGRGQLPDGQGGADAQGQAQDGTGTGAKGLVSDGDIQITGGTFTMNCADDAIHANGDLRVTGGSLSISTGDDAVHADGALAVDADLEISSAYEGLEGSIVEVQGGTIRMTTTDDGINAAGDGSEQRLSILGGDIQIQAGGDALDSNGDIQMSGGSVQAYSTAMSGGEQALDYIGDFTVSGGTLDAGGSSTGYGPGSESPCSYVYASGDFKAGSTVTVRENGRDVHSFSPLADSSGILAAFPGCMAGAEYEVWSDGALVATVTAGEGGSGLNESGMQGGFGQRPDMGGQRPGKGQQGQDGTSAAPDAQQPEAGASAAPDAQQGGKGQRPEGGRPERPANDGASQPADETAADAAGTAA